jgi:hypothetical protein
VVPLSRKDLPVEALNELRASLREYARLRAGATPPTVADAQIADIQRKLDSDQTQLAWQDVALVNLCTVQLLLTEGVRIKLMAWRRRLQEVVGDHRFAQYITAAPDIAKATETTLRADLNECIAAVFYFYAVYGIGARSRASVTKRLFITALLILVAQGLIALALSNTLPFVPSLVSDTTAQHVLEFLLATSAAATVGSVVSVQRRLQDPNVSGDPFFQYIQTTYDRFGIAVVSPIFGAIFGIVIYGLLVSNLISSKLIDINSSGIPNGGTNVAMLLIFGFLAGFAEQLVPDALTRIAVRALGSVATTPPIQPAPAPSGTQGVSQGPDVPKNGVASNAVDAGIPLMTLVSTPGDVTPEAKALGHDPTLTSEPSLDDLKKGVA